MPKRQQVPPNTLPLHVRQLIVELKAEHPPLRVHEIGTICYVHTVAVCRPAGSGKVGG